MIEAIKKNPKLAIAISTYTLFLFLSLWFYKERTILFDTSYQLFSILLNNDISIQSSRFGAAVTQVWPLLASRIGLSLATVTALYSLSFFLFYFVAFLITYFVIKNRPLAYVILLFNTIMMAYGFFWIQCELIQGIVFTLMFMALVEKILQKESIPLWFYPLAVFALFTMAFFHPLLPVVVMFCFGYFFLHYRKKPFLLSLTAIGLIAAYKTRSFFLDATYDSKMTSGALNNLKELFPNYLEIRSNDLLGRWIVSHYQVVLVLFVAIIIFYIKHKKFKKLALFLTFIIGYLFLINITYWYGAPQYHLESHYQAISVFLAIPLVYEIFPKLKKKTQNSILALIALICFVRVFAVAGEYTERLAFYRKNLQETEGAKVLVLSASLPRDLLKDTWGLPFEMWLLSTIEGGETRCFAISDDQGAGFKSSGLPLEKSFCTTWGVYEFKNLNPQYFIFKDTTSAYKTGVSFKK